MYTDPSFHLRVDCDEYSFYCVLMDYQPAVRGTHSFNADSDWDYNGYDMEFEWECVSMDVYNEDGLEKENVVPDKEVVQKYCKQIDEAFRKALEDYEGED